MTGAADPMMAFPDGTVFTPFSVARNVSSEPVSVTPSLYWMQSAKAHSARLHAFTLLPFETRQLDVASLLTDAGLRGFNGSLNLILEAQGQPRALLLASGSVDQKNTYVFQVLPHGVQDSAAKTISYWSTAKGDDTMVTVWNPADKSQDYRFTLFFAGGQYVLPIHLEARATRTLNVSSIIENQIPDENGNTIPGSVHEGSAKLSGAHDAGTYNVRKATCSWYCISCDGEVLTYVVISPFAVAKGGTSQLNFQMKTNTGSTFYASGSWTSGNTSAITVGSTNGVATGVGSGKATMNAYTSSTQVYNSSYCAYDPFCPYFAQAYGSGPGTGFQVNSVSPSNLVLGGSGILTISGQGFQSLTSPTAQFGAGSGITTGTLTVVSDLQMTVSYQVTCSALVGGQSLQIGTSVDGGISGTTWPESVVLPSAPTPIIKFGGNTISGTLSVVVGQQIALTSSVSLPPCTSISSQQWSTPPGTAVGGYAASTTSGSVTALPSNTASGYTFYWVYPGTSLNMTYQYTMAGGGGSVGSPVATATFNVAGPTGGKMTTTHVGTVGITTISGNTYLQFGTSSASNAGVLFTPSATAPSGYSNTFIWAQLISTDSIVANGSSCSAGTGLDNAYPYPPVAGTNTAGDSPAVQLLSTDTSVSRTFAAEMYLLWSSGLANSIPVPLGSTKWSFSGTATKNGSSWSPTGSGSASSFVASSASQSSDGYPIWSTHTTNGVCHSDTN